MVTDNIDVSVTVTNPSLGITINSVDLVDETVIDGGIPSFTKDPISGGTP